MVLKSEENDIQSHHPATVMTIYSDNHGETWSLGEAIPSANVTDPNESTIAELNNGGFVMNIRNESRQRYRAIAISETGIKNWSEMRLDTSLPDPMCFGSMARFDEKNIFFINCCSQEKRENLTVYITNDDCKSWKALQSIQKAGGYADIAVDQNETVHVLHEKLDYEGNSLGFSIYCDDYELLQLK